MRWSATSKTAASTTGTSGKYTRTVQLSGRCPCGATVTGTASVTTVLGESGTAVATTTDSCGETVQLTGEY